MPSHKANRTGTLAERAAAEEYRLRREGEHTSWCDAVDRQGRPVEIKSTDLSRDYPRFRVFEEYHDKLAAASGSYVFVAFRRRGEGIQVVNSKRVPASRLPGSTWYGAGGHRDSRQRKIAVSAVF